MASILVIEDDEHIRQEVMDWLQFEAYQVFGAANGRSGLELAFQVRPDLILCDIAMPEMNGHEVLLGVRANIALSDIPFIFLTASADRDSIRRGMDAGADDYLTKPFTHAEVLNAVRSRLGKKEIQDQNVQTQLESINIALRTEHEKLLLKSRLVAMFSHDFRNPLAAILSFSEMLREGEGRLSAERKYRYLDRIDGAAHQLLQMLDDMLTVAEMESGHLAFLPQSVALPALVQALVDEFRLIDQGLHTITLHITLQRQIEADPKLIKRILSNLIGNAIKYSPPKTRIEIFLYEQENHIFLEVQDQGIGIPETSMPRLFEPFQRADNARHLKGSGLGLTIVKECVDHHQGTIAVSSEVGKGTRFTVQLPLTATAG